MNVKYICLVFVAFILTYIDKFLANKLLKTL